MCSGIEAILTLKDRLVLLTATHPPEFLLEIPRNKCASLVELPPTYKDAMTNQLSLFSESTEKPLLAELKPSLSASELARFHQKIYQCPSHGQRYYKYVCSIGHKIAIQRWIPGGNIRNRTAQRRAAQVSAWIVAKVNPLEIDRRIQQWQTRRKS
jgi:hypothetical protein